ncbi:hypothetical protein thalar_00719 [Litoreibacter arenae DSM 19593]|uniref:Uncharacterized protein n=1 Tax=Litoreibacter arenae DSM 19593 TaxID=1123360 RepID=S9S513_9RHOB|nr:hypothetical protein thalar_00719 [Litoreibacter arenae DSM 19593]
MLASLNSLDALCSSGVPSLKYSLLALKSAAHLTKTVCGDIRIMF